MKATRLTIAATAAFLTLSSSLFAIDRDAKMIDTVWVDGYSFDYYDYIGLHITGENTIQNTDGKWAILAGVRGGSISPDIGENSLSLGGEIGLKYYFTELTSIAGLGGYMWNDADDYDFNVGEFTARLTQRFIPATRPLSPYIKLEAAIQFVDMVETDNIAVYRAFAGCDVLSSETMAFVFEGGYSESDNLDDGIDTEDGWVVRLAMRYYWN